MKKGPPIFIAAAIGLLLIWGGIRYVSQNFVQLPAVESGADVGITEVLAAPSWMRKGCVDTNEIPAPVSDGDALSARKMIQPDIVEHYLCTEDGAQFSKFFYKNDGVYISPLIQSIRFSVPVKKYTLITEGEDPDYIRFDSFRAQDIVAKESLQGEGFGVEYAIINDSSAGDFEEFFGELRKNNTNPGTTFAAQELDGFDAVFVHSPYGYVDDTISLHVFVAPGVALTLPGRGEEYRILKASDAMDVGQWKKPYFKDRIPDNVRVIPSDATVTSKLRRIVESLSAYDRQTMNGKEYFIASLNADCPRVCDYRLMYKDLRADKFFHFLSTGLNDYFPLSSGAHPWDYFLVSPDEKRAVVVIVKPDTSKIGQDRDLFLYTFVVIDLEDSGKVYPMVELSSVQREPGWEILRYRYKPLAWRGDELFVSIGKMFGDMGSTPVGIARMNTQSGTVDFVLYPTSKQYVRVIRFLDLYGAIVYTESRDTHLGKLELLNYGNGSRRILVDFSFEDYKYFMAADVSPNGNLLAYQSSGVYAKPFDVTAPDYHPRITLLELKDLTKTSLIDNYNIAFGPFGIAPDSWIDDANLRLIAKDYQTADTFYSFDIKTKKIVPVR